MPIEEYNSIRKVAEKIKNENKKVTLLYGFNGTGKTRLSMEFKDLIKSNRQQENEIDIIYYNAYTEDLFTWDNDLENNSERKIKINLNSAFINLLKESGRENEVAQKFKELTFSKIEPNIDINTGVVTFSLPTGDDQSIENIKISRGEESVFIWTMFYSFIQNIIEILNEEEENRSTDRYNNLKYIYIDDPVSSLDDSHIIELAINLIKLVASSEENDIKFIISTHHTLFYSVLFNELRKKYFDKKIKKNNETQETDKNEELDEDKKKLKKIKYSSYFFNRKNEIYSLNEIKDNIFSYHLKIKQEIQKAIDEDRIEKYHYTLFRNLLEKTANYLGYTDWGKLIVGEQITDENRAGYIRRINLFSHNNYSDMEPLELEDREKQMLKLLFNNFKKEFRWEENSD